MPRSLFAKALIETNYDLIFSTQISKFGLFTIFTFQIIEVFFISLDNFISQTNNQNVLIDALVVQNAQVYIMIYLFFSISLLGFIVIMYFTRVTMRWLQLRKDSKMTLIIGNHTKSTQSSFIMTNHFAKILNSLLIINTYVFTLPNRILSFKVLIFSGFNQIPISGVMIALSVLILTLDIFASILQKFIVKTDLPLKTQPLAQANQMSQVYNEMVIMIYALVLGMPHDSEALGWIFPILTVVIGFSQMRLPPYYCNLANTLEIITYSSFFTSSITLTVCHFKSSMNKNEMIVFLFCLTIFLSVFKQFILEYSFQENVFKRFKVFQQLKETIPWIQGLESSLDFHSRAKSSVLRQQIVSLQTILKIHYDNCKDSDLCACQKKKAMRAIHIKKKKESLTIKKAQQIKMIIIEAMFSKILYSSNQEKKGIDKNNIIGLYLIEQKYLDNPKVFQSMYNLAGSHDCNTCSLSECLNYYILRRTIISDFQKRYNPQFQSKSSSLNLDNHSKELIQIEQIIKFEQCLKGFLESVISCSSLVSQYWSNVLKGENDIDQSEKLGLDILDNYKEFLQVYKTLERECGEHSIVENVALKIHQDVLSFEQESIQNFEKLKTLLNKRRVARINNSNLQSNDYTVDMNSFIVVIGASPHNFQKILMTSKSFTKFSGYTDEFLLKNKITCVQPRLLGVNHENILKRYLKKMKLQQEQANYSVLVEGAWLKRMNGLLRPIIIKVVPKIDINTGLQLIAQIIPQKLFEIFDARVPSFCVYCIITDVNYKIHHVSENTVSYLRFPERIDQQDIQLQQIFKHFPENPEINQVIDCYLDLSTISLQGEDDQQESQNSILRQPIRVLYQEVKFSSDSIMRQFVFVTYQQVSSSITNEMNTMLGTLSLARDSSTQMGPYANILEQPQQLTFTFQRPTNNDVMESFHSEQEEEKEDQIQFQSMSSTSSNTSSLNNQDQQISEIKSTLEYSVIPKSLKIYRIKLIIGLIILLATAFVLLAVNIQSKDSFRTDIDSLKIEKDLRNSFSLSKLQLMYLFSYQNNDPKIFNQSSLVEPFDKIDVGQFFQEKSRSQIARLHTSLTEFSTKQALWDDDFVYLISQDRIVCDKLTQEGNYIPEVKSFFIKSVTLFIDNADYIANSPLLDLKTPYDIFAVNSIPEFQKTLRLLKDPYNTLLHYFYYSINNGAGVLLTQMLKIDDKFIQLIANHGDDIIRVILIFTICCCSIIVLMTFFYVPYFSAIEQTHSLLLDFLAKIDKQAIALQIRKAKDFESYVRKRVKQGSESNALEEMNKNQRKKSKQSLARIGRSDESMTEEFKTYTDQQNESQVNLVTKGNNSNIAKGKFGEEWNDQNNLHNQKLILKKKQSLNKFNKTLEEDEELENDEVNTKNLKRLEEEDDRDKQNESDLNTHPHFTLEALDQQRKISKQTFARKTKHILLFFVTSFLVSAFYVGTYLLSNSILLSYQNAFYSYDVFFTRVTCVSETLFFMQKTVLFNDTMGDDTYNGQRLSYLFDECTDNEMNYRAIKKDGKGMFQSIGPDLEKVDSTQFCKYLQQQGIAGQECDQVAKGQLNLGLEQLVQSLLSHIQQKRINFISRPRSLRDPGFLQTQFFEKETYEFVLMFFQYMQPVSKFLQEKAHASLLEQMDSNFVVIITIFTVYIIMVVFVLSTLVLIKMIRNLHTKLLRMRILLKIVPALEIYKYKETLEKIDTHIL